METEKPVGRLLQSCMGAIIVAETRISEVVRLRR